jgi:hypothetical protein
MSSSDSSKISTSSSTTDQITGLLPTPGSSATTQGDEQTLTQNRGYGTLKDVDEDESLLSRQIGDGIEDEDEDRPLPMAQIFFLCFARMVDPISYFCIFPFVNQMIFDTGNVKEEDVGFYSGLIVSLLLKYANF